MVTIQLEDSVAQRLSASAHALGMSLEDYLASVANQPLADSLLDREFISSCQKYVAAAPGLEAVRQMLSPAQGSFADEVRSERDER